MKILVIEAYTDANIGSCAVLENSVRILQERYPTAQIRVMAHNPEAFRSRYGLDCVKDIFNYPFKKSRPYQLFWLIKAGIWMGLCWLYAILIPSQLLGRLPFPYKDKLVDFLWADIVISVGAERINDKFYRTSLFSLYTCALIKRLGKSMIIFPSTIGPFLFGWTRCLARRALRSVDLVYTRDELSKRICLETLKLPADKVINTSDVAVVQESIQQPEALGLIGARAGQELVGISAMRWTYFKNRIETSYSNYSAYVREMATFADAIIEEYGVLVVFYPTNFPVNGCCEDDVSTAFEIVERMKNKEKTIVISELRSPRQFKGMLACSELNVTTRMHACILSTGALVPTISVNYLFKLREYMTSLGLGEFSIDIEEFCANRALDAFSRMWPERTKWREHLRSAMDWKKRLLENAMARLDDLV